MNRAGRKTTITCLASASTATAKSAALPNSQSGLTFNSIGYPGAQASFVNKFNNKLLANDLIRINPQIVILSFGLIGMTRMQGRMVTAATDAQLRTTAIQMADELLFARLANGGRVMIDLDDNDKVRLVFDEEREPEAVA